MASNQFDVTVRVEINKVRPDTGAWTGERMSISEDLRIGLAGWTELASILGQFHQLADSIRLEQEQL